jgi:FHS family L-fucose permease-like MFS transporter
MAITPVKSTTPVTTNAPEQSYGSALAMVTTLFFMWGFLTSLNDILVPHLKSIFELSYAKVMLIQFSFFLAYFVFSMPAGKIIDWIGYKKTMVTGLMTMGLGALLFIPSASVPSFGFFISALFILAAGMTLLQVSANPYVAVLGPPRTASSRLNLTQAFNSLGTTIGPPLGGLLILSAAPKAVEELKAMAPDALQAYRIQEASSVKLPYLVFAAALILLGIVIAKFKLPAMPTAEHHKGDTAEGKSVWQYRHLVLGAVGIFTYVGAEVAIGSFLINYISQPGIGNISQQRAAALVGFYWGGAMVGRFIGSALLQKIETGKLLGIHAIVACLLVLTSMMTGGHVAMWTILAVGLFNSIMFPSIFTLGIAELGPLTGDGSGVLIMAIVGGALIPVAEGALADRIGIQHAFILPAICYLYIMYYAFKGSKPVHA